jgi:hypothetical protein
MIEDLYFILQYTGYAVNPSGSGQRGPERRHADLATRATGVLIAAY